MFSSETNADPCSSELDVSIITGLLVMLYLMRHYNTYEIVKGEDRNTVKDFVHSFITLKFFVTLT